MDPPVSTCLLFRNPLFGLKNGNDCTPVPPFRNVAKCFSSGALPTVCDRHRDSANCPIVLPQTGFWEISRELLRSVTAPPSGLLARRRSPPEPLTSEWPLIRLERRRHNAEDHWHFPLSPNSVRLFSPRIRAKGPMRALQRCSWSSAHPEFANLADSHPGFRCGRMPRGAHSALAG
jgi:hypothetical protein